MMNFAIIGFGGLGKVHFRNIEEVTKVVGDIKLVAICDIEESAFTSVVKTNISADGGIDLSAYNLYTDLEEMLNKEKLDFVITALPTYVHEKIAVQVMERGIHVFSEKPMAISPEQAQNMIDVAKKNNVKLMIGQCLRYFPSYRALKELIDTKEYGEVKYANFTRLSMLPKWSWNNWFQKEELSGGVTLDLHVHDLDFINYAFGKPESVYTKASTNFMNNDTVVTHYNYAGGALITATASWAMQTQFPFTAEFIVAFEKATVESRRGKTMIYTETEAKELDQSIEKLGLPTENGYSNEVIDFINCIRNDSISVANPPESSKLTIDIAYAEKKSAAEGKEVAL